MDNKAGKFIPFFLPFSENGHYLTSEEQAMRITNYAQELIAKGAIGVAITYSANYDQTQRIAQTYSEGNWNTHTSGANQAAVMTALEELQIISHKNLQHKIRIAPITTMTYSDYGGKSHEEVVVDDLYKIEDLLRKGWMVLGWMNQNTAPNYAVGGGIAELPEKLSALIQANLKEFEKRYS